MKRQAKNTKDKDEKKKPINKEAPSIIKSPNMREPTPIVKEDEILDFNSNHIKENLIFAKPCEIFPEWPSEEELKNFNYQMINEKLEPFFDADNEKIKFPVSLENCFNNNIKWLRPNEFVRNFLIQKEIKTNFPNKQVAKMKQEVKDYYYSVELLLRKIHDYQKNNNFVLKKDFYPDNNLNSISSHGYFENEDQEKQEKPQEQNEFFNNENLEDYRDFVLDSVESDTLNNFNEYNTNAFNVEIHSNKQNKVVDKNIVIYEGRESFNVKRDIYKSFFKFFESQQKFKIVNISERNENEEEIRNRLEEELKNESSKNNKANAISNTNQKIEKNHPRVNLVDTELDKNSNQNKIKEIHPSNLYLSANPKPAVFTKWITSILQLILDVHLTDANTNRNILFNIYPQKDNFPIVSPSGRYWIKLYFMGKPRKIEIDDRIPCNNYEDFILPRCENLDEIWPALITKALLKLYSYKFKQGTYNELADLSFICSLLGLYVEKIPMNSHRIKYMDNFFMQNLEKNNGNLKITTFACMNFSDEDLKNNSFLPNSSNQFKKNFNFNFRVLDADKDLMDTSMARFSVKSKVTIHQDSIIKQPSKPKFSSLISKIFKKKSTTNMSKPIFRSLGEVFLRKGTNSENFEIPEKIEKEDAKELNIDESEINFNIDHKHRKNETADSDNLLANLNFLNQNASNIQNQTHNHPTFLAHKTDEQIIENENEGSVLSKKYKQVRSGEKYYDLVNKLKNLNKKRISNKTTSVKMLRIIDISNNKAEFKLDEKNMRQEVQPDGLIKSIGRTNKAVKSTLNLVKFDEVIANNEALNRDDILHNFVYSILEFFDNKKYNMNRLRPMDFSDLKRIVKDAQPQGVYKRLSVGEKKKYLSNLLEMKNKQIEIKNKRIEEIKIDGKQLYLIKIKNDCIGVPRFDFFIPYCDYDIYMAKKCIINEWFLPPPTYYSERFPKLEEEKTEDLISSPKKNYIDSTKHEENKKKKHSNKRILLSHIEENVETHYNNDSHSNSPTSRNNASELYFSKSTSKRKKPQVIIETMHQLLGDKTDYSLEHNEPITKFPGGTWVNYNDFKKYFNSCLFFYNEKKFRNILNLDNNWIYNYDCYEFNYDFSIIYLHTDNSLQQLIQDETLQFSTMIVFEPNNGNTERQIDVTYYINFDLIDSSTGKTVQDTIHLSNFYSNIYLENLAKNKNYFLVLKSYLCPFGFNLKIMSDFNMEFTNYNDYLKKFANYQSQKFSLEHLNIEKNKNYLLAKFSLKVSARTRFKILINHSDCLAKNSIEIYLLYGKNSYKKRRIGPNNLEIFTVEPIEDDLHYFVFMINSPYNIKEDTFEIEFIHNTENFLLETLEYIEPYKLFDRISVNKYGVIFKEQITCLETVYTTMEISLKSFVSISSKTANQIDLAKEQNVNIQVLDPSAKSKLTTKDPEIFKEKIRMKIKIVKNNEVLLEEDFYNAILIDNFIFENPYAAILTQSQEPKNSKNQTQQVTLPNKDLYTYHIICSFDLSEFDNHKNIDKNNMYWEIRIFSSESLSFCKDTSKEDREKAVKDSWENNDHGRSELAKTSRLRFLGINKKLQGEVLSTEEEKIVNSERKKKITQSYDNFAMFEKMNNAAAAKRKANAALDLKIISPSNAKQPGKNFIPDPIPNEYAKYEKLELRTIKIKPEEHRSYYIRNFINYSTKERTITKGQYVAQSQRIILNDQLRKRKIEKIDKNFYNFEYIKKTENDETLKTNTNNPETLKLFYKTTSSFRQQSREGGLNLLRQRDFIRGKMERLIDFERNINDILLSNNNLDFNYMATIYSESLSIEGLNNNLRNNLFKFISNKKNEFYYNELNKLTAKDKNSILKYIDDIRFSNFELNRGLIEKFEALLIEAPKKKK